MPKKPLTDLFDPKIIELVRPYSRKVLLAIAFSVVASASSGAIAWMVKPVIDSIFVDKKYSMLVWLPLVIILVFAIQGLCQMIYTYLMKSTGLKLVRDLRVRLYDQLLKLSISSINAESSGKLLSRIINDTGQLRGLMSIALLTLFKEIPTILVLVVVALYRRWDVTLLALLVLPGIAIYAHRQGKRVKEKRDQAQILIASLSHFIVEASTGAKVVKSFTHEKGLFDRFQNESNTHYRRESKIVLHKEKSRFFSNVSTGAGVALVIWYGGSLVVKEVITSGDLFSALGAIAMIFGPIKNLSKAYNDFQELIAAANRIWWLERKEVEKSGDIALPQFKREICFDNVSHTYTEDGELVLNNICLTIRKGEVVAIVGPSGAGKTTLIDLVPKFYEPTEGRILIDGYDLKDVQLQDLRKLIGIVNQDIILFNDSIKENIAFGAIDASDEDIIRAAKLAYAHDFIKEFPEDYDTQLGERGVNLSGGQRQRIAIARAILKNPPILILDEATSALDSVSEALVQRALDKLMQEKTTIVVAHRLSTIRNADRILVMEHGRIVTQGSHDDLMKGSREYQELYQSFASTTTEEIND
jgi:ATP-binding cassette, subfamily B, bacterial MsbA